jgi:hypothetical protein
MRISDLIPHQNPMQDLIEDTDPVDTQLKNQMDTLRKKQRQHRAQKAVQRAAKSSQAAQKSQQAAAAAQRRANSNA